jgi:DNA-binding response OmpR family regulator
MRILLIEDNSSLAEALTQSLRQREIFADCLPDTVLADRSLDELEYDALVLDLGLPGQSGMEYLAHLRSGGRIPIPVLILTARDAIRDRVQLLNLGADDYLVKPCDADELAARLRAIVRRSHGGSTTEITYRNIAIDRARHLVALEGVNVKLSRHEFRILTFLVERRGRVQSRTQIEDALYGWGESAESNSIEVHIHNLRKKLGRKTIETVRGVGYRSVDDA